MIHWLEADSDFPPVERAARRPNGLLAAGGDLSPERLLRAYKRGIFPWYSDGDPVLWWSPDPRMVLFPAELNIGRSLKKTLKRNDYEMHADSSFATVIEACSGPRAGQDGTWITAEMKAAYQRLHGLGYAHSIETWRDGELIGGLYGIGIGRMFYGESMFSRASDASKIALCHLVWQIEAWGFGMIDCQMNTPLLSSLGAREIPRVDFMRRLTDLVNCPDVRGPWMLTANAADALSTTNPS